MTVAAVVESKQRLKLDAKNRKISELKTINARPQNREQRQNNYIYQPYFGYQSYYVTANHHRPTKQPHRRPTTTQRYTIWQLSRKRRNTEVANETGDTELLQQKHSINMRKRRQIDASDVNYDYYPYNFQQLFGRKLNYDQPRNQPYTMWDLTRRK